MPKLLIIGTINERGLALLRDRADVAVEILSDEFSADDQTALADADALLVRTALLDRSRLAAAPHLKVVSKHGVGYDNVDLNALTERGIPLTVTADANAVSVAEHTLYLMLSLARRGAAYDAATRRGDFAFRNSLLAMDLVDKNLLIMGFGRIGSRVARRCLAFDMRVNVYDPNVAAAAIVAAGCRPVDDLDAALAAADLLTLHFPGGGDNVGFIDRRRLALLPPGALLINAARGDILDQDALTEQLRDGRLGGAALDVFAREPIPADHPLLGFDHVVLSPHSAATSKQGSEKMAIQAVRNALAGIDGRLDPAVVINPETLPSS